jgi:mutual gliding-motility protein MglA
MSMINYASREINCKLVYYGPGLGGKTTNLEYVYNKVNPDTRGKLISLATEQERTLFFDFLPVDLGSIRGFKTRFHLYTVPGQVYYNASRRLILKGVDGLVFVADSQAERMDANIAALENLYENLSTTATTRAAAHRAAVEQAGPAERGARGGAAPQLNPMGLPGARGRGRDRAACSTR